MTVARRRRSAVRRGMVTLVRLVLDDDWHPVEAARKLREMIADQDVLDQMAARVKNARAESPSWITARAGLTLTCVVVQQESPSMSPG